MQKLHLQLHLEFVRNFNCSHFGADSIHKIGALPRDVLHSAGAPGVLHGSSCQSWKDRAISRGPLRRSFWTSLQLSLQRLKVSQPVILTVGGTLACADLFSRVLISFLPPLLATPLPHLSRHLFALFSPCSGRKFLPEIRVKKVSVCLGSSVGILPTPDRGLNPHLLEKRVSGSKPSPLQRLEKGAFGPKIPIFPCVPLQKERGFF